DRHAGDGNPRDRRLPVGVIEGDIFRRTSPAVQISPNSDVLQSKHEQTAEPSRRERQTMSSKFVDILKNVGESISQSQGLKQALSDIGHDAKKMVELGASELVNGIHHGQAFVLYGPNQRPGAGDK